MSFFKNIFGKSEKPIRTLTKPDDLLVGDIIVLTDSFALPDNLRKQEFRVSAINSYEYEHHVETEWALMGNHGIELYLTLEIDDQTELKFSLKIAHEDIEALFDLDQFALIFEEDEKAELITQQETEKVQGWTSESYHQSVFAKVGYFHRKDHRTEQLSSFEGKDAGEQFELYVLYDDDQSKGIDVEVWQDGDTDVFLTLFRPISDIVDMYPGS
jgi:hypothetical protein